VHVEVVVVVVVVATVVVVVVVVVAVVVVVVGAAVVAEPHDEATQAHEEFADGIQPTGAYDELAPEVVPR